MAFINSESVFLAKVKVCGLSEEHYGKLRLQGWQTIATFAFAAGMTPSQTDEAFAPVLEAVVGDVQHRAAPAWPKHPDLLDRASDAHPSTINHGIDCGQFG